MSIVNDNPVQTTGESLEQAMLSLNDAEESHRRQHTREIAAAILEGRPLQDVASLIADIVAQRLQVERVGLFLMEGSRIIPIALRNISPEYGADVSRLAPRGSPVARATATKLPTYIRDVRTDPRYSPEMRALFVREGITSVLITMLQHGEQLRGVLIVYPSDDRQFNPQDLSALQGVSDMATLGIAISQQMEERREIARVEERNRLAREIHDTVAQSLVSLVLQIETTQTCLDLGDAQGARTLLLEARDQARKALQETRRAVQNLAPSPLETMSLSQAIARELETVEALPEAPATQFVTTGEEQDLTPEQCVTLLRIAQEAINNARKHARAQRIRVGLHYGGEEVTLRVEDDGAGFDMQARRAPGPEGGYGLFGMAERARLVNGLLEIDSSPGWGTRIRTQLPYHPFSPVPPRVSAAKEEGSQAESRGSAAAARAATSLPPSAVTVTPALPQPPAPGSAANTEGALPGSAPRQGAENIRVIVVDDHTLARQGIRALLEQSGEVTVVGEGSDGGQALPLALETHPDVVLMDLQMPEVDGLEGLRRLHAALPDLPVVIVTTFAPDDAVAAALLAGACGFLLKDTEPAELLAAVRAVQRGETVLAPGLSRRLGEMASGQPPRANTDLPDLNEREREVLELLARGMRNKEIGSALFIAPKTVEGHLANIFSKLGVSNRTEAARIALDRGLVPPTTFPHK